MDEKGGEGVGVLDLASGGMDALVRVAGKCGGGAKTTYAEGRALKDSDVSHLKNT